MRTILTRAYAKINISLDVISKMADGYHSMLMVMQSVGLYDDVKIKLTDGGFRARVNLRYVPGDERNDAVKAAKLFFEEAGIGGVGAEIELFKRIPVCAGLGGGSSDAAAVLRALNNHFDKPFSQEQLESVGAKIGSDIPFCIRGGTAKAEGRGEIITPLKALPSCHVVICKPECSISTPVLFSQISCGKLKVRPDTNGILEALDKGDLKGVARRMYNVFEDVLPQRFADIREIKGRLLEFGALGALMTGTGSAVFGLFEHEDVAQRAFDAMKAEYKQCFLTETIGEAEVQG